MDSGSMAKLEIKCPKLACHGQTGGWPNGEMVESGRGMCESGGSMDAVLDLASRSTTVRDD